MEILEITSKLVALLAMQMLVLSMLVSFRRVSLGKSQGDIAKFPYQDGGDETLRRRMRAFGNFIEYTPMCVIIIAVMEFNQIEPKILWWLGGAFIAGRLLHSIGMLTNPHFPLPRILGMLSTYAALIAGLVWWLF